MQWDKKEAGACMLIEASKQHLRYTREIPISTTQKLLRFATLLSLPIFITTQNAARLGPTCPELNLPPSPTPQGSGDEKEGKGVRVVEHVDKTAFSMWIPEISRHFEAEEKGEIVILGIESHICVTQTALDALGAGHKVYIIADGVSSCNREEIPVALARLRGEGAVVTTSESFMYECMGDAAIGEFKEVARLVKEFSGVTKESVGTLLSKI
ncbi:Isochorismatase domain-containing protein 2, partial [Lachnellula cervina]